MASNSTLSPAIRPGESPRPRSQSWQRMLSSDPGILALVALGWLVLLILVSILAAGQYGFHRDELNFIENARHLDWGYVEYPPLTPFIGWLVIGLFEPSQVALHFTTALAVCVVMWLTGMMTRDLGGDRLAQIVAAFAAVTAPIILFDTRFFSYQTFDLLWWVLTTYLLIRLLKSDNPRWWLAIGLVLGLGMLTKYAIPFLVAALAVGLLLTPARRYLKSPWLWAGAGLALLIFLPNAIWQAQHGLISLAFQASTRAYNIKLGRTGDFLIQQLYVCANPAAITLWTGGLFFFFTSAGKRYRLLNWFYLASLAFFMAAQGRFYYMAGLYPVLIAAGTSRSFRAPVTQDGQPVRFFSWAYWGKLSPGGWIFYGSLVIVSLFFMGTMLPVTPVNTAWWHFAASLNPEIREQIGWSELVGEVAHIYAALPAEQRAQAGIIANNYGEASAINLYGPANGLPEAISGVNTYWLRGYGKPLKTLIVVGMAQAQAEELFTGCRLAGHTPNPYDIVNEETRDHPDFFVCGEPLLPWPAFWKVFQSFG